jgi:hypothetical protein
MDSQPFLSRNSFLGRKISRHLSDFHSQDSHRGSHENLSRRKFLTGAAAGTAGLAFWIPERATAQGKGKSADPKPIPSGVSPLGIFIHHFPAQPTATPLSALNEPSQITDFKGFVGLNRIRGGGRGSGFAETLAFQADMGFMKGVFIAEDGKLHEGVFGFI